MKPYLWGPCGSVRGYVVENANDGRAQVTFMFIYCGTDDHMPLLPHSLQGPLPCLECCGTCGSEHQEHLPCLASRVLVIIRQSKTSRPCLLMWPPRPYVSIGFVSLLTLLACLTFVLYVSFFLSLFFQKAS